MILTYQGFYQFQIFKKFPEIVHGISTKKFGDMKLIQSQDPEIFLKGWQKAVVNIEGFVRSLNARKTELATTEQVHGGVVKIIAGFGNSKEQEFPFVVEKADGLITNQRGLFLFVAIADCFPILVFEPQHKIIGIAHAGWRGIHTGIVKNLIDKMKSLGAVTENILVGVGPGICHKHYEVKEDVAAKFNEEFLSKANNKIFLNLEAVIISPLLKTGVKKENIKTANVCTFENEDFFSARRDKTPERFAALIGMKE